MAEPRVNEQVRRHLFELLFVMQDRMKAVVKNSDAGLSPLQIRALRTLVERGEMTQSELGEALGRDKSQITRLVTDLKAKRLVAKKPNAADGRSFMIAPEDGVRQTVQSFALAEKALVSHMLTGAEPRDIEAFDRVLVSMKNNLDRQKGPSER